MSQATFDFRLGLQVVLLANFQVHGVLLAHILAHESVDLSPGSSGRTPKATAKRHFAGIVLRIDLHHSFPIGLKGRTYGSPTSASLTPGGEGDGPLAAPLTPAAKLAISNVDLRVDVASKHATPLKTTRSGLCPKCWRSQPRTFQAFSQR